MIYVIYKQHICIQCRYYSCITVYIIDCIIVLHCVIYNKQLCYNICYTTKCLNGVIITVIYCLYSKHIS